MSEIKQRALQAVLDLKQLHLNEKHWGRELPGDEP